MNVNVKIDIEQAMRKCRELPKQIADKAVVRALNKTIDQGKVEASKEIRAAGYKLKAAVIKKGIVVNKAKPGFLRASMRAIGRPVGLIDYGARPVKAGVSVEVKSGRKLIKHAFIRTMPSGHRGVFIRVGKAHKKVGTGRSSWHGLPIKELFGPSIPTAFLNAVVQTNLERSARTKFPTILKQEINYLNLKRQGAL